MRELIHDIGARLTNGSAEGLVERAEEVREHHIVRTFNRGMRKYLSDRLTLVFFIGFVGLALLAIFGPFLAPYDYGAHHPNVEGRLAPQAPSGDHLLGTNGTGQDVLSRLLFGARPTILTGFAGGAVIVSIGLLVGVTSGYFGGQVDNVLMRIVDFAYGIPIIPTAIVLVAYIGMGFWSTVLLIGLLLWRGNARVFRSQVLQIKEREHVQAAKMLGASNRYVVFRHILPNMAGMVVLFFALGTGLTILLTAALAFLGFMDPLTPTWGIMLRNAYGSGYISSAWWWTLPSGFAISITVLIVFMLGRGFERVTQMDEQEVIQLE